MSDLTERERALLAALEGCQKVLADMVRPMDCLAPIAIASAWANCVAAETQARAAIALASTSNKDKQQ